MGVEAHAGCRRGRYLGRRADPDPARPRRRPLHDVLGISDRVPAPARWATRVGAPRARRQLRRAAALAVPVRPRPVPPRLLLVSAAPPPAPTPPRRPSGR